MTSISLADSGARGRRRWRSVCQGVLCACLVALAAPGSAGGVARCRGAWLVAADACYVAEPRVECGMLIPQVAQRYLLQGTWPQVVGPYTAPGQTCHQLRRINMAHAPHADEGTAGCARLAGETVHVNLGDNWRAKCGRPMFLHELCTDQPQGAVFSFLYQVEVEMIRTYEDVVVREYPAAGRGETIMSTATYAACRHPANGEAPIAACWAEGDAFLTGPGLAASEMLAGLGCGARDVVAVCLTNDVPPVGLDAPMSADLAAAVRAASVLRQAADCGNLAR